MPTANYDQWKLATPWDDCEEIVVQECACCGSDLYAGESVWTDEADNYFCNRECAEKNAMEYLDDYLDCFEDLINTKRINRFKKYLLRNWETLNAFDYVEDCFGTTELEAPDFDYDDDY